MIKRSFILPAILILLTLWGLVSLGFWQLDRADEKRSIENAIVLAQSKPAKLINKTTDLLDKQHYQVLLRGYYDGDKQFIYDNQIVKSNAGYYVLTPFMLSDSGEAILVNRGFVPWQGNRDKLANIALDNNQRTIKVGLVELKERIQLKQQAVVANFPVLVQSLNVAQLSQLAGYQIVPMLAQLDITAEQGFYRQWQPFYGSVDKHLGYALQWFLMALVLFFIAIGLSIKHSR